MVCWMSRAAAVAVRAATGSSTRRARRAPRSTSCATASTSTRCIATRTADGARAQRHRARPPAPVDAAVRRRVPAQPRHRQLHPHRRGDERHRRRGHGPLASRFNGHCPYRLWPGGRGAGRHDRHRRGLADDADADPRVRRHSGHRDRQRPRLRRRDQDGRRLQALAPAHRRRPAVELDGARLGARRRGRRLRARPARGLGRPRLRRSAAHDPGRRAAADRRRRRSCGASSRACTRASATRSRWSAGTRSPPW